jgi:hypothetical protein
VVGEVIKSYYHRGVEPRIFCYRTKEKMEVDLLVEKNGRLLPVEIKLSSLIRPGDLKGISSLRKTGFPVGRGAVIASTREPYLLSKGMWVIPPSAIG